MTLSAKTLQPVVEGLKTLHLLRKPERLRAQCESCSWATRPNAAGHWEPFSQALVEALQALSSGPTASCCSRANHWQPSQALLEAL